MGLAPPIKNPITVKADSDSPIENLLIRMIFPQPGDEPDIPMNPVGAIAKGAFFKKVRQALREQAINLRVRGVLSPREADAFYAEQIKSLEPLKHIKKKEFKDVYGVVGSPKRLEKKVNLDEPVFLQEMKEDESPFKVRQYEGARDLLEMFDTREGVRGFATGTSATTALTGQNELRPIISLTGNYDPQELAGDTIAHEFLHARSRGALTRKGKYESKDVIKTRPDKEIVKKAALTINTAMPNIEELFAEVGSAHITGNNAKIETLKAMGLEKQVEEIGSFVKSLLKSKAK